MTGVQQYKQTRFILENALSAKQNWNKNGCHSEVTDRSRTPTCIDLHFVGNDYMFRQMQLSLLPTPSHINHIKNGMNHASSQLFSIDFRALPIKKEGKTMQLKRISLTLAFTLSSTLGLAGAANATPLAGWTGTGNFGALGADGVVTLSPHNSAEYGWVSTYDGVPEIGLPGVGGNGEATTGSTLTSALFAAEAGDNLSFFFNYITSDGGGFADYAWARLLFASDLTEAALLFTSRTTPGGNTVPGFNMPAPSVLLDPVSTPIISGAPVWAPLGNSAGTCFSDGCGYTGWINASYSVSVAGNYLLQLGVVNWNDDSYQSGLAFDGATIGGRPITPPTNPVPEPELLSLLGLGLASMVALRRRFL